MIPNSSHVPASVNRGVVIVLDEPKHPVSVALRAFADKYIVNAPTHGQSSPEDSDRQLAESIASSPQPKAHRRLFRKAVS
jgi:MinD-like ATPase involved in chromosome partitioning or flagellar assembly